jgi:WhiB family redox-sensing transcriptional regulator
LVEETWISQANCRNVPLSVMFPSDGAGVEVARRVCEDCPVRAACLEYALENLIPHGVWGGTSERERRRMRRRRRAVARPVVPAGRETAAAS